MPNHIACSIFDKFYAFVFEVGKYAFEFNSKESSFSLVNFCEVSKIGGHQITITILRNGLIYGEQSADLELFIKYFSSFSLFVFLSLFLIFTIYAEGNPREWLNRFYEIPIFSKVFGLVNHRGIKNKLYDLL